MTYTLDISNNDFRLKVQRFTPSGCKDKEHKNTLNRSEYFEQIALKIVIMIFERTRATKLCLSLCVYTVNT